MAALLVTIGIVIGLAVLGFAVVGVWGCFIALSNGGATRSRLAAEARQAETEITGIGRRAQEAIMAEVLKKFDSRNL